MPAYPTMIDIAKKNGSDSVVGLLDETTRVHPELTMMAARTVTGTYYKTRVRTSLGRTTGSFRRANRGTANIIHQYENRITETYTMNPRFIVDKAVADKDDDGPVAFIAGESSGVLEGEMQGLSSQMYYGNGPGGNTEGFPGLIQCYDRTAHEVDAGGTAANATTSVWLIFTGLQDTRWVFGANGEMSLSQPRIQSIDDGTGTGNMFEAYISSFNAYPGLQVNSQRRIVRIKNISTQAGHTLTDALIVKALTLFPASMGPNLILSRQEPVAQLQQSRVATTETGAPAQFPLSYLGLDGQIIPIKVTEALSFTEPTTL